MFNMTITKYIWHSNKIYAKYKNNENLWLNDISNLWSQKLLIIFLFFFGWEPRQTKIEKNSQSWNELWLKMASTLITSQCGKAWEFGFKRRAEIYEGKTEKEMQQ